MRNHSSEKESVTLDSSSKQREPASQPEPALDKVIQRFSSALIDLKGIINELIHQKEQEAAAALKYKSLEQHYRELFDSAPGAFLLTDTQGIIQESNQAAVDLLQMQKDALLGKRLNHFVIINDYEDFYFLVDQALQKQDAQSKTIHLQMQRGIPRPILLVVAGRRNPAGEVVGFNWLMHVHTQDRQDEESQKSRKVCLDSCFTGLVKAFSTASEMQDPYASGHQKRVAQLASAIAQEMGFSPDRVEGMNIMGLLHDIGNVAIPPEILTKTGLLTVIERNILKTHPQMGYELLKDIEFPWPVAQAVFQHHERWDGSGYPAGLSGEDIIIEARILAVAEVIEAMVSPRPQRVALGIDKALGEVYKEIGVLYDPQVVDASLKCFVEKVFKFP